MAWSLGDKILPAALRTPRLGGLETRQNRDVLAMFPVRNPGESSCVHDILSKPCGNHTRKSCHVELSGNINVEDMALKISLNHHMGISINGGTPKMFNLDGL